MGTQPHSSPYQEVIPPNTADNERGKVFVKATREGKVIDTVRAALHSFLKSQVAEALHGTYSAEVNAVQNVRVPTPAYHQELGVRGGYAFEGRAEIGKENDVTVDVANQSVSRDLLSASEHVVQAFGPDLVSFDMRLVMQSKLGADFRSARVVAEKYDFHVWGEALPTL